MTGLGIAEARSLFSPEPAYLNTASTGLPPRPAFEAFAAVADEWRHGRTEWMVWNEQVDIARGQFARLVNVSARRCLRRVAGLGVRRARRRLAVARRPRGVPAEEDFTSVLFPLLAMELRGVVVDLVPLDASDAVTDDVAARRGQRGPVGRRPGRRSRRDLRRRVGRRRLDADRRDAGVRLAAA